MSTTTAPATALRSAAVGGNGLLAILLTGQFMAIVDVSIVNVAAPTMRTDLSTSGAQLQLIVAGYTIAYAVLLITGARLGARHGHRTVFLVGLAAFTAASLACGLAQTSGQLIAFRFGQGVGAALMVPQVLSLIQRSFHGAARARALSLYAAAIAGGAVIGQISGGVLVAADLFGTGWRPVFLVNVPVGLLLLLAGLKLMPRDTGDTSRSLDLPGLALLVPTALAFIVPLVLGHEQGWPLWGWLCLLSSALLGALFVAVERRVSRAPLIPGHILRIRSVVAGVVVLFGSFAIYGGWLFCLAVYVQSGLGWSPLKTGLLFLPGAVGFATASLTWRRLPEGWHRGLIPVGLAVATVAMGLLAVVALFGDPPSTVLLSVAFALKRHRHGLRVQSGDVGRAGRGAAGRRPQRERLLTTTLQLAQAVGVAVFGTLYLSLLSTGTVAAAATTTALALAAVEATTATLALLLLRPRPAAP
jgi:MFS family permease